MKSNTPQFTRRGGVGFGILLIVAGTIMALAISALLEIRANRAKEHAAAQKAHDDLSARVNNARPAATDLFAAKSPPPESIYDEEVPLKADPQAFARLGKLLKIQRNLETAEKAALQAHPSGTNVEYHPEVQRAHVHIYELSHFLKETYAKLNPQQRKEAEVTYKELAPGGYLGVGASPPGTLNDFDGDKRGPVESGIVNSFCEIDYMSAMPVYLNEGESLQKEVEKLIK